MDWQTLINLGASGALGAVAWFVRASLAKQDRTAAELTELRVRVAQDYVTHSHLRDIKDSLIRIEGKLDTKVDK